MTRELLTPSIPFALHETLYQHLESIDAQSSQTVKSPFAAWIPTEENIRAANVTSFAKRLGKENYTNLQQWSISHRGEFWEEAIREIGIVFETPPEHPVETPRSHQTWFPNATLNITDSCFTADPDKLAITAIDESGETSNWTYAQLENATDRIASCLIQLGYQPGDRIGLMMPMSPTAVSAFLGIIRCGCVAVPIAESFAPPEIRVRLEIANAKCMLVSDVIPRSGKNLPCYEKVKQAAPDLPCIVFPNASKPALAVQAKDVLEEDFLRLSENEPSVPRRSAASESCILFSSGTTGTPKAIPWTHLTPIKCAVDARFHQNINSHSNVCWPTSLGWMMGPWLVYASLINHGRLALFMGTPTTNKFCRFVETSQVTMLGVVPSLVQAWRKQNAIDGCDWSKIQAFSSTGECSKPSDMLYLMSKAKYKPVIEYCGGTEIGGGYISSTVVQPSVLSAFSTPTLGMQIVLSSEDSSHASGEAFLVPPSIGLSERLLNADHESIYYEGTPQPDGLSLRRHGDYLVQLEAGYFHAGGRTDDTMNLGGIKVSSVEIERCLNQEPGIVETAAVGFTNSSGGPTRLAVVAVIDNTATEEDSQTLQKKLQTRLREHLNPLFRIDVVQLTSSLPRTSSNKILRRELRKNLEEGAADGR